MSNKDQSPRYQAQILKSINEIEPNIWDNLNKDDHPFTRHAFLKATEDTGCVGTVESGWIPRHIIITLENDDTVIGAMPLYLKTHSQGEYVFDHGWADALTRAGGQYYPKIQVSVPFTPVTGPRFLTGTHCDSRMIKQALISAAHDLMEDGGLSSLHFTFLVEEEAKLLEQHGFLLRNDQQFHWKNDNYHDFDQFLATLSSRKRKQIKKERRIATANDISIRLIEGKDITKSQWQAFYKFYMDTGMRKWGRPYLNEEFFLSIGASMPENIMLILCMRNGEPIAGALNFKSSDTLYGRYWGCSEDHPCLHFETCYYQAIDYAIEHRLKTVEAGAQGQHKVARGYQPTKTYSAHFMANESFQDAVHHFLIHERAAVDSEIEYLSDHLPFKSK